MVESESSLPNAAIANSLAVFIFANKLLSQWGPGVANHAEDANKTKTIIRTGSQNVTAIVERHCISKAVKVNIDAERLSKTHSDE